MQSIKIVVLGGSGVATPLLASALVKIPGRTQPLELVLVGRSAEKLARVTRIAQMLAVGDALLTISCETHPEIALQGADIVLNQVRVGGLEARVFDETFPLQFGLAREETVGPGGFANAVRTIPVALHYAKMIERVCPKADVITFTNPASLVQSAISRYTHLNAIGLCDIPVSMRQQIAGAASANPERVWLDYVGMHHFGWVVGARENGRDILPLVLESAHIAAPDIDPAITRSFKAVPSPYLSYIFHPEKMYAKKQGKRARAAELIDLQNDLLVVFDTVLAQEHEHPGHALAALARRNAGWYESIIVPVIMSLVEKHNQAHIINFTNKQTFLWLPTDAIVEAPVFFQNGYPIPAAAPDVPQEIKTLVQTNCAYEMLVVDAIVERNREKALRALLLNPIIRTYEHAVQTLEFAWG